MTATLPPRATTGPDLPEGVPSPVPTAVTTYAAPGPGAVLLTLVAGVVGFLVMGLLGRAATFPGATLSLVWPAAGGAILVLALAPRRWWPAAGALLAGATFSFNFLTGIDALRSVVFVVPNVVQAFVGALLLRWSGVALLTAGARQPLVHLRDFVVVGAACLLSSLAAVVTGTVGLLLLGADWQPIEAVLWWGRNCAGSLVVVSLAALLLPPTVGAATDDPGERAPRRLLELAALVLVSGALYLAVFGYWSGLPLAFPLLVPTVWAGLRFTPRVVGLHSLVLSVVVVVCTLDDVGPFAEADTWAVQALVSQLFVALLFGLGVLLALGSAERRELHRGLAAAHDAAADQAALLTTVIDSMHEGLTVIDERGAVLIENPAGQALVHPPSDPHQPLERFAGEVRRPDGVVVGPHDLPHVRALRGEEVYAEEVHLAVPGRGPDRVLSVSARRLPFATDAGLPQAVVIFHDVTAQQAQQTALESFARVLAHDLKGPLSVVEGWTELLAQQAEEGPTVPSAEVVSVLDRVSGASGSMRRLIQDLLESATARDQQLRLVEVDLHALATAVVRGHLDRADAAPASVEVRELPPVRADAAMVRQLLENLVGNALKYVEPGRHAEVVLRGRRVGDRVELTVADRGIGICAADRDVVFEAFHRAEGAGRFEGHGIGLSVCRTIVQRHGGSIVARGRSDGPGTAFVLTLPAAT